MSVKIQAHLRRGGAQGGDEIARLQRIQNADRVRNAQTFQPGFLGGPGEFKQKPQVGPRGVLRADGEKLEHAAKFGGQFRQGPKNPIAILLPRAQVKFRYRQRKMRRVDAATGGGQKVRTFCPAPGGQTQGQPEVADGVDVVHLALSHRRDADFDLRHAGAGQGGGDVFFLRA